MSCPKKVKMAEESQIDVGKEDNPKDRLAEIVDDMEKHPESMEFVQAALEEFARNSSILEDWWYSFNSRSPEVAESQTESLTQVDKPSCSGIIAPELQPDTSSKVVDEDYCSMKNLFATGPEDMLDEASLFAGEVAQDFRKLRNKRVKADLKRQISELLYQALLKERGLAED